MGEKMSEKFILVDLDDERSKSISEVLGNKTCKKILEYLSDLKEASENDISKNLSIPINTVEYNLNKLIKAGLIEKSKKFFWSVKGKRIDTYKISNKKIVISPKSFIHGLLPALLGISVIAFGIKVISDKFNYDFVDDYSINALRNSPSLSDAVVSSEKMVSSGSSGAFHTSSIVQNSIQNTCSSLSNAWAWFLFGGLVTILIFLLFNQFKKMKGGI